MYKKMNEYIADFTKQLTEALEIAEKFSVESVPNFDNVVICGMGGSGIGGTILSQMIEAHCPVPVIASKDYSIPAFVSEKTLVIACSYSGNTEETLEALAYAQHAEAYIVCISSGGKLTELAHANNWPLVVIPGGVPPRAAFAYPVMQLFRIAELHGMTSSDWNGEVRKAIAYLDANEEAIRAEARKLAEVAHTRIPVIYATTWLDGVGARWQQQLAENAKMLSWHNAYPEMNHNEVVGWRQDYNNLCVVFLHSSFDHPSNTKRMNLTKEVYKKYTSSIFEYHAVGDSKIEHALHLIHLGDWMTEFAAELRGMDSVEVDVIDWLKGELAKA
jgi:glucose/mannose-6-phosphate isomerase